RTEQVPIRFDRDVVERPGLDGEPHSYYRYSLPLEYRASQPGAAGPLTAQLRGTVYVGVRRGLRGLVPEERELLAGSPPVTIPIAAVPKQGQPDAFTGGIGMFKLSATAQPTKVRVGDPITLTVRVTGSGTLEDAGPPKLASLPKWDSDFKVHDDP